MGKKSQRKRQSHPNPSADAAPRRSRRRTIAIAGVVALALALVLASVMGGMGKGPGSASGDRQAALASSHAPSLGDPAARVHVVEFIDPACETCALFFPLVKQVMAQNPGKIRLSVRHLAFHQGSDFVVRMLEASRNQDKYWPTLETLLATQSRWAINHVVQPQLAMQAVAGVGLDMERLMADMNAPEVTARIQRDLADAKTVQVTATPEYFINGRPLPSFGQQQLLGLIAEELQKAY